MKVHPYLNFEGTTEEASGFYPKVLGGTLTHVRRDGALHHLDFTFGRDARNRF